MKITIYGMPSCGNCKIIKNRLDDKDIEYEYIEGEETIKKAREVGVTSIPISIVDGEYKSYFEMVKLIKEL